MTDVRLQQTCAYSWSEVIFWKSVLSHVCSCFWYWWHLAISYVYIYIYVAYVFIFYFFLLVHILWSAFTMKDLSFLLIPLQVSSLWSPLRVTMSPILLWHPFLAISPHFLLNFHWNLFLWFPFVLFLEVQYLFQLLVWFYQLPFHDFILGGPPVFHCLLLIASS